MHPVLFQLGPFTVRTFGVMAFLGFVVGASWVAGAGRRAGLEERQVWRLNLLVFFAILLGGRVMFMVVELFRTDVYRNDLLRWLALLWRGGLAFYGGLFLALVAVLRYARRHALPVAVLCDLYAMGGFLGESIGRWGCFFAGDDYGKPAPGLPWAVTFTDPRGDVPEPLRGVPLHPTQLYLSALALVIFIVGRALYPRRRFDGQVAALSFMSYAAARPVIEVFRGDAIRGLVVRAPIEISTSQLLSPLFFLIGVALWRWGVSAQAARGTRASARSTPGRRR